MFGKQNFDLISKIPKYLPNIFLRLLYPLNFIFSRKENIWVFGSWKGQDFLDNTKYMFLYTSNNHRDKIRAIWLSRNDDLITELNKSGYECYHINSLKGIYYNLKAKYIFVVLNLNDVNFWCSKTAIKVQLAHGIPIKKIERDSKLLDIFNCGKLKSLAYHIFIPYAFEKYDFILITSNNFKKIFCSAFGLSESNIINCGLPRNDALLTNFKGFDIYLDKNVYHNIEKMKLQNNNSKLIAYVPTFRDRDDSAFNLNLDLIRLNEFLIKIDSYLLLKLHPGKNQKLVKSLDGLDRVINLPNNFDIYTVLRLIDILVTDYSSIYFDYLLLDKPIIFYSYDLNLYLSENRELYFDYNEITPGPKASTFDELLKWIEHFASGRDGFLEARNNVRNFAFQNVDSNSSEKLYRFFVELSNKEDHTAHST
jgi:CDP-glycerol glycerophosphotransferase (TagB/SpsB family)